MKKLPAEYKELHVKRFDNCFGELSLYEKIRLLDTLEKINKIIGINTQ